jgi:DNA-binding CsgD family transcriptional regulator
MPSQAEPYEPPLRALLNVIEDIPHSSPEPAMPWLVMIRLLELIRADRVVFNDLEPRTQRVHIHQTVFDGGHHHSDLATSQPLLAPYWRHRRYFRPNAYQEQTGDLTRILTLSDFYTAVQLRNDPFYAEYLQPSRVKHCLTVAFPTMPGQCRTLRFFRQSGHDFTDHDRLILQLLRPHLQAVHHHAEHRRHTIPDLTRRQRQVLHLAASGYSNADIARILVISTATVRKHMENIFDRTGVRTRTAAAALITRHLHPPLAPLGTANTHLDISGAVLSPGSSPPNGAKRG